MAFNSNVVTRIASPDEVNVTFYDSNPKNDGQRTIMLLHGTGGSAENNFWALFPMLAMRHRVVALEFVDPESDSLDAAPYVAQVLAVVKEANSDGPVHLVGFSFGAVIAALVAARHSSAVASLTLVAGWVKTDNQQRLRNEIWHTLHRTNQDVVAAFSVFTNFSQAFLNSKNPAEIEALVHSVRTGPDRSRKMAFNKSVDISQEISNIQAPSLVVGCTQDITAPIRHSRTLFGGIHDCRYAEINSGHGVVHERPSELFTMIDTFVCDPLGIPSGTIVHNSHA